MRLGRNSLLGTCLLIAGVTACQQDSPTDPSASPSLAVAKTPRTYLISLGTTAPSDLAERIELAGGKVKKISVEAGVATATSDAADFAAKVKAIPGVDGVGRDRVLQWVDPGERVVLSDASIGDNETFFNTQWSMGAINAPQAWDAGARGNGVRVAVLDGGLNNTHIDLMGSVDEARSRSFVPGFAYNQDVPCVPVPPAPTCVTFSHATHVAGTIAAQDDAIGAIGVAPGATIIGVKVLHGGGGSFEAVIEGIIYAATPISNGGAGAQVINMSLGATFVPAAEDIELMKALDQATKYAWKQGVTVIVAAGNDEKFHDKGSLFVTVPAQSQHVISVSATGPMGWGVGYPNGAMNFTRPASYTNFGKSVVSFAAPGGDFALPGNAVCAIPRIPAGTVFQFCWALDMVISPASLGPDNGNYFWAAGTSMAAPHVAGVAALIIERNGGSMAPAQVEAKLQQSSSDLGKPGNDEFYGHGFVNALRAIQ